MPLADVTKLAALKPGDLQSIRDRLRELGVTYAASMPIFRTSAALPPMLQAPIRRYHARKLGTKQGVAMRALLFQDPVTREEARDAFGADLDRFLDLGILKEGDDGIVGDFVLGVIDDLYVFGDVLTADPEAVMGFGPTTMTLARAGHETHGAKRVLEIGCGAGTIALSMAKSVARVVATDISARAVQLTRINAAMNDLRNVEVREGSLFDPVRGERFDLVLSQPPFVARPPDDSAVTFLHGGARGDELPRALIAELPEFLAQNGRGVLLVEWPDTGEASVEATVKKIVGDRADVLVLQLSPANIDNHAAIYEALIHPTLDPAFERAVLVRRGHFDAMGVRALVPTLTVVSRGAGPRWSATLPMHAGAKLDGRAIDRMIAARVLAADPDRLRKARLRMPAGIVLAQEQVGPGSNVPSTLSARFPPDVGLQNVDLTEHLLILLTAVHESRTVDDGIARFAEQMDAPKEKARETLGSIADALRYGLLQVA